jgi:predicted N-formylglutamate amidohydrolase
MSDGASPVVVVENPDGSGPFVIVCDHASNRIPAEYGPIGLSGDVLTSHIVWDPGALGVARRLSAKLDAPLLWPDVSRVILDCNRQADSNGLIVVETERGPVDANRDVTNDERARRLARIHAPYHDAIDACIGRRDAAGRPTALVAIHSYTPVFFGRARPWQIGIVFGDDRRLADILIRDLKADPALTVGINQPYSPADQVYYTVARHSAPRQLPAVMIEIRNDEIADDIAQREWADRLAAILAAASVIWPARSMRRCETCMPVMAGYGRSA